MNIEPLESSPYPLRVTDSERRERESLTESSQNFHLVLQKGVAEADMGSISDEDEWGLDPSETEDDDSRYFLEQEAIKMTRSGLELKNIADFGRDEERQRQNCNTEKTPIETGDAMDIHWQKHTCNIKV
jgi:hypothetical protein